jgi:hypothetical protein
MKEWRSTGDVQMGAELADDRAIHLTGSQIPVVVLRHRYWFIG